MSDSFELDQPGLASFLGSLDLEDGQTPPVRTLIAAWSDDNSFLRASPTVLLAQLTYLLGISPHVTRPEDFPAHSLLGISGTFHGDREMFFVALSSASGPYACIEDSAVLDLLEDRSAPQGPRLIQLLAEAMLDHANQLIPSARAAAAAHEADTEDL
jgi:hypothetical protein